MNPAIYAIGNCVTGHLYIGQTKNYKTRWAEHRRELRKGTHRCPHLQRAWKKYGANNFIFLVLIPVPAEQYSRKYLEQIEEELLAAVGKKAYNVFKSRAEYAASLLKKRIAKEQEQEDSLSEYRRGKGSSRQTQLSKYYNAQLAEDAKQRIMDAVKELPYCPGMKLEEYKLDLCKIAGCGKNTLTKYKHLWHPKHIA